MTTETNPNIDPSEINKFNAFAADWWDPDGHMKPLHRLNPLRLAYIQQHVDLDHKQVLDVGCGGGLLSEAMAKNGALVTGIDMSDKVIQVAREHAQKQLTIDYQQQSVESLAKQKPAYFDVVTCMEMLEHVPQPELVINACATLVKPGGKVFFSTINRNLKSYLFAIIGAEYLLQILPKGTHHYGGFIRPGELSRSAKQAQLIIKDIQGIRYHLIKKQFETTTDVSVNYLACYTKKTSD